MTWKEFKEKVESLGAKDDDRICYIDISDGDLKVEIEGHDIEERGRVLQISD